MNQYITGGVNLSRVSAEIFAASAFFSSSCAVRYLTPTLYQFPVTEFGKIRRSILELLRKEMCRRAVHDEGRGVILKELLRGGLLRLLQK